MCSPCVGVYVTHSSKTPFIFSFYFYFNFCLFVWFSQSGFSCFVLFKWIFRISTSIYSYFHWKFNKRNSEKWWKIQKFSFINRIKVVCEIGTKSTIFTFNAIFYDNQRRSFSPLFENYLVLRWPQKKNRIPNRDIVHSNKSLTRSHVDWMIYELSIFCYVTWLSFDSYFFCVHGSPNITWAIAYRLYSLKYV